VAVAEAGCCEPPSRGWEKIVVEFSGIACYHYSSSSLCSSIKRRSWHASVGLEVLQHIVFAREGFRTAGVGTRDEWMILVDVVGSDVTVEVGFEAKGSMVTFRYRALVAAVVFAVGMGAVDVRMNCLKRLSQTYFKSHCRRKLR
jgi:hypothetical protein